MKQPAYLFVALIFLGVAALQGAQLKLIQPNGGENLALGSTYLIKWSATGVNEKIRLVLLKGGAKLGIIASDLNPASSQYLWTVGKHLGGTATAGQDYKVRIRTDSGVAVDASDAFFSLKAPTLEMTSTLPHLQQKVPHAAISAAMQTIQVLEPAAGSKWAERGTFTIRWKTFLKKSPTIELYNYNGTKKVATITPKLLIVKFHDDGLYHYDWTIPAGTYSFPGNYTIRVSADDGKVEGFSAMFHVDMALNMVEKSCTFEASVDNRAHRHYSYRCTSVDTTGTAFPPGPGPGILRVGWENSWKQWGAGNYCYRQLSFAYRSFITFDVSALAKGKIIQEAMLHITKESTHYSDGTSVSNDHPGQCASKLFQVLAPWSSPFDVQADLIGDGTAGTFDITAIVRGWALKGDNHGLMLIGRDESYRKNNEECISYYRAVLNVKYLENEG
jgi:hypothetical protein